MPVLMQVRAKDLDPALAQIQIDASRQRVLALLAPNGADQAETPTPERQPLSGLVSTDDTRQFAMTVLTRRLAHIEHAARKVARLAARPVIEDNHDQ